MLRRNADCGICGSRKQAINYTGLVRRTQTEYDSFGKPSSIPVTMWRQQSCAVLLCPHCDLQPDPRRLDIR